MDNNSTRIGSYLQNEMSDEERISFEQELAANPSLLSEMQIQQMIGEAAYQAGLKASFAKAIQQRVSFGKWVRWGTAIIICTTVVLVFTFRKDIFSSEENKTVITEQKKTDSSSRFIRPPLTGIDIPFTEFHFDAEKGDTLFISSGSVVYFPPSSMTDEAGNIVKGDVVIRYREFRRPIDFFVSGINMNYDSAGTRYNFESSGMCELNAYQAGKALLVNQQAKPEIFLSSDKIMEHNLYYLDTISRKWVYNGKDLVTEIKKPLTRAGTLPVADSSRDYFSDEGGNLPVKPLRPVKASDDRPSFSVQINPGSFEELFAYDKMKFEVLDEKNYRRSDAEENWSSVKLDRTETEGIYTITFTKSDRTVSYKVKPVLEDVDYDAALKIFNQKNLAYEDALKNRKTREKNESDSIIAETKKMTAKMDAAKNENERINALIIARNKQLKEKREERWKNMSKAQAEYEKQLVESEKQQAAEMEKRKKNRTKEQISFDREMDDQRNFSNILQSFSINNFGIWNCDNPVYRNTIPLYAKFKNEQNKDIQLRHLVVIFKGFNGLYYYEGESQIRVIPGQKNMILMAEGGVLYYYTYSDFDAAAIKPGTNSFEFRMRSSQVAITSYAEFREIADKWE